MSKILVVLGILCLAAVAMANVTMDFTATKDAGIDASYGEHTNRGGGTEIRFCKGGDNGEAGIFDFDRVGIQTFINNNLGGLTLQQAINQGKIQVNFSLVAAGLIDPNREVGVRDVYTNDVWIEGAGDTGAGDDTAYNWPGALTPPFAQAVTQDGPADYLGLATGGGGGNWTQTDNGFKGQQFKNIPGTANGAIMTGWATGVRTSVPLDDVLWAEYIYGVDANDVTVVKPATTMLRTYGFSWDSTSADPTLWESANMTCYTKESGAANAPKLTVTIAGDPAPKHPGDANNDGAVDVVDLGVLARNYDGTGKAWETGDFNADGVVDVVDLGILARNYDWVGAPAGQVPEPMTLSLLAVGAAALLRRKGYAG